MLGHMLGEQLRGIDRVITHVTFEALVRSMKTGVCQERFLSVKNAWASETQSGARNS